LLHGGAAGGWQDRGIGATRDDGADVSWTRLPTLPFLLCAQSAA
jgi:hypothetical protein